MLYNPGTFPDRLEVQINSFSHPAQGTIHSIICHQVKPLDSYALLLLSLTFYECISMELARNHGQLILIHWVSVGAKSQKLFTFIFWVIPVLVIRWFFQSVWLVNCIYLYFFSFAVYVLLENANVCFNWLKENKCREVPFFSIWSCLWQGLEKGQVQ